MTVEPPDGGGESTFREQDSKLGGAWSVLTRWSRCLLVCEVVVTSSFVNKVCYTQVFLDLVGLSRLRSNPSNLIGLLSESREGKYVHLHRCIGRLPFLCRVLEP